MGLSWLAASAVARSLGSDSGIGDGQEARVARQPANERDHLRGKDLSELHRPVTEHRHQELTGVLGIVASGPGTYPADPPQVLIEGCEHFLQSQLITACHQLLLVVESIR